MAFLLHVAQYSAWGIGFGLAWGFSVRWVLPWLAGHADTLHATRGRYTALAWTVVVLLGTLLALWIAAQIYFTYNRALAGAQAWACLNTPQCVQSFLPHKP